MLNTVVAVAGREEISGPPIVETKLMRPRARPQLVDRPQLLDRLDELGSSALTLVSAPVGFGKTTLVRSWCERVDVSVAWVSLDPADDDPMRLWKYVATAVDRVREGLGRGALQRLRVPGALPGPAVEELVNGMAAYGAPLVVVLDDVHTVRDETCLESLGHAVELLPPNARFVATSRADPGLPLGRLRARGVLGEIRARDLAFDVDEARTLLVDLERIELSDDDVEQLVERTEGWPAGLYLAALWLRGHPDPHAGVEAFRGTHHHVVDYLTTELLDRLDADTRTFLLETSMLGRFNAAFCDAVLDRRDSHEVLQRIQRTNGFLIALDGPGDWFRYHQLFAETLRLELGVVDPEASSRLHARAYAWCGAHGFVGAELEHAAAIGDPELIAATLDREHLSLLRGGQLSTLLRWCGTLDDGHLTMHPVVPIVAALACGASGRPTHERRRYVSAAERARAEHPTEWLPYHETGLGLVRLHWIQDSLEVTIVHGRTLLAVAREHAPEVVVSAIAGLAYALYHAGALDEAKGLAQEVIARPDVRANTHGLVQALALLGLVETETGLVEAGEARAREAVAFAEEVGIDTVASGGAARVALAVALAAQGTLAEAEREARAGEAARYESEPELCHLHALLVLADVRTRRGRFAEAAENVDLVRRGLATFEDAGRIPELLADVEARLEHARAQAGPLTEPPTEAELNVLRLLATDLSQREIGATLFLSVNTVKTHTRSLYRKLGATSRDDAVVRASALGLLDSDESPG